ncbi:hypothetical protein [Brevibacillus laterosporus]|uniref:hypothetical protein n=1 Tax=Brevibacillus laterosporus TaxID=1465 RepID=UPI0018CD7771|nr:hypothetical protein [Brevibacillus laterosporus]MBG9788727.1 hypothetical protein [Brevibacillus laterosporus]
MERKQKLNNLAKMYKLHQSEKYFDQLYSELLVDWHYRKKVDARRTLSDEVTILALYEDALLEALRVFDGQTNDFMHLLNQWINRRRIDLQRTNLRRKKVEMISILGCDRESDVCANILETLADSFDPEFRSTTEEAFYEKIYPRKKERDKRELVSHLIESAKTLSDEVTVKILTEFSKYDSPNKLAKALGLHHETVNRKLRRVSRLYDANRFGDLHEYLAV